MAYENHDSAKHWINLKHLPEFSSFLKNVRISQIIQEKIAELNYKLKKLQNEPRVTQETFLQLNDIEHQIAELVKIKEQNFSGNI